MMKKVFVCLAVVIVMSGCGDKAKSIEYYREHIDEAQTTANQCQRKQANEVSAMSPSQQAAWNETAEGINCRNAAQVMSVKKWNDSQRELGENADNFVKKFSKK